VPKNINLALAQGKYFVVRTDGKLTPFLKPEAAIQLNRQQLGI